MTTKHLRRGHSSACAIFLTIVVLAVSLATAQAATEAVVVEGTFERVAHGSLEVRSIKDCKLYSFDANTTSNAVRSQMAFATKATSDPRSAFHKRFINIIVVGDSNGVIHNISPSDSDIDGDKKCITSLGNQHADGTISEIHYGNNSAGFTLHLANGHTIDFAWTYDYSNPSISPALGEVCDQNHQTCVLKHRHARVDYRIQQTGDGSELVPLSIRPL